MVKNNYQRSLMLLRRLEGRASGHVRLERRLFTASLTFTVNGASDEALHAALVRCARDEWIATDLGELQRSGNGQSHLNAVFDPRDVGGAPYDAYALLVVARAEKSGAFPVLCAYLREGFTADWSRVRAALAALYCPAPLPIPEAEDAQAPVKQADPRPEIRIDVKAVIPELASEAETEAETGSEASSPVTALTILGDAVPWPAGLEAERTVFQDNPPFTPFPAPGYVFVRAPLPEACGYVECAIGARVEEGRLAALCYALPGDRAPEPPAGLEGFVWREGWWAIFLDAGTGAELAPPPVA